jgi:hypothetical protein
MAQDIEKLFVHYHISNQVSTLANGCIHDGAFLCHTRIPRVQQSISIPESQSEFLFTTSKCIRMQCPLIDLSSQACSITRQFSDFDFAGEEVGDIIPATDFEQTANTKYYKEFIHLVQQGSWLLEG